MSADAVYNSIKLETLPTVYSTQVASTLEEETLRFMFFEFDHVAKGDGKGIPLLCLAEFNGMVVTGLAKLNYSPLFTRHVGPYLTEKLGGRERPKPSASTKDAQCCSTQFRRTAGQQERQGLWNGTNKTQTQVKHAAIQEKVLQQEQQNLGPWKQQSAGTEQVQQCRTPFRETMRHQQRSSGP
ncbi:hypothetical protein ARMGADRAFT_1057775 [Armillaria gallica]|uniref:Uncharacterized protein n=1 Tax=Armillaria gallica TaxID=47427 RepID=A0A2H3EFQ1_ARMGA|nr:hypothetical protein ARMGADRAFT_1057775 [Armillaria gallica]